MRSGALLLHAAAIPDIGAADRVYFKPHDGPGIVLSLDADACDAFNGHQGAPHWRLGISCSTAFAALQEIARTEPEPSYLPVSADEVAVADAAVREEFVLPTGALKREAEHRKAGKKQQRRNQKKAEDARRRCVVEFDSREDLIFKCMLRQGRAIRAMTDAAAWIKRSSPSGREALMTNFGLAFLTDELLSHAGGGSEDDRALCAGLYKNFMDASATALKYPGIGPFQIYAFARRRELDRKHADHYIATIATTPSFAVSTLDPKRDTHLSQALLQTGVWEAYETIVLSYIIENDAARPVFVDIGANIGWFTLLAASKGARVIAFEPVPGHCRLLRQSLAFNGFSDRAMVFENIVSSRLVGEAEFINVFRFGPSVAALVDIMSEEPVQTETTVHQVLAETISVDRAIDLSLPSLLSQNGSSPSSLIAKKAIGAIKIDVEGCEIDALLSARRTVTLATPEVLIEMCPQQMYRCGTSEEQEREAWDLLLSLGYQIFVYRHDDGQPKGHLEQMRVRVPGIMGSSSFDLKLWRLPVDAIQIVAWIAQEENTTSARCFHLWATQAEFASMRSEL